MQRLDKVLFVYIYSCFFHTLSHGRRGGGRRGGHGGGHGGTHGSINGYGAGHSSAPKICTVKHGSYTTEVKCYTSCCDDGCCPEDKISSIILGVILFLGFLCFLCFIYGGCCCKNAKEESADISQSGDDSQNYGSGGHVNVAMSPEER